MYIYRNHNQKLKTKKISNRNTHPIKIIDFFNNIVEPYHYNYIIAMYLTFDKPIDNKLNDCIRDIMEKHIDYGFCNIIHIDNLSCMSIRFDINYDDLCQHIETISKNLEEYNLTIKCNVIYEDKNIDWLDLYDKLEEQRHEKTDEKTIIHSNYFDYIYEKENP